MVFHSLYLALLKNSRQEVLEYATRNVFKDDFACTLCPKDVNVDTKASHVQTSNPVLGKQPGITFYDPVLNPPPPKVLGEPVCSLTSRMYTVPAVKLCKRSIQMLLVSLIL